MRILLLVALLATPAYGDSKYKRKQDIKIAVKLSKRSKPIPPSTPVKPEPTVTSTQLMQIEIKNQPIRDEQAAILAGLIADTPDSDPDKPDLMFRLAEHYAAQLRIWRLQSNSPSPAGTPQTDQR